MSALIFKAVLDELTSAFPFLPAAALKQRLTSELALFLWFCELWDWLGIGSGSGSLINVNVVTKSNEHRHVQFLMGCDC